MMLPSRSVRKRWPRLSAPPRRAQLSAGPFGGGVGAVVLSEAEAISDDPKAYLETPALLLVPSYRLLVLLYGTPVVLSRNFRPVSTPAGPVRVWLTWYM